MHRSIGGGRLQKARAYAGGETRAQLHDGHTINEEGKTVTPVHNTYLQGRIIKCKKKNHRNHFLVLQYPNVNCRSNRNLRSILEICVVFNHKMCACKEYLYSPLLQHIPH